MEKDWQKLGESESFDAMGSANILDFASISFGLPLPLELSDLLGRLVAVVGKIVAMLPP